MRLAECQMLRAEMCVTIFESPLRLGVLAKGSCVFASMRKSVPTMLQRSMTLSLYPARGPTPPKPRELRLCRLPSSIVYLSSIYEDCKYRVLQPFGSWDMFIIPVMILILIGMLVLCTVSGVSGPFRFTRSRNAVQQFQTAGTFIPASVQAMLSPSAPQASVSGSSPELNSVGATVPLQATP